MMLPRQVEHNRKEGDSQPGRPRVNSTAHNLEAKVGVAKQMSERQ